MAKEPTSTAAPAATALYAVRAFNDAGTGRSFKAGKLPNDHDLTDGEIENYRAAGLVTDQKPKADNAEV
jgi:hypothetical protein